MSPKNALCRFSTVLAIVALAAIALAGSRGESAGEVDTVCKSAGIPAIQLRGRDRATNLKKIRLLKFDSLGLSGALGDVYRSDLNRPGNQLAEIVDRLNAKFAPESEFKRLSLKYSTKEKRLSDLSGYKSGLIDQFHKLVPSEHNRLKWFLSLKDPALVENTIRPNDDSSIDIVYGAQATLEELEHSKFKQEIVFSIETSEAIPYLIPLIVHELQHAFVYKDRIRLHRDARALAEFLIVDEAIGNDLQLQVYLELAKKDPKTFCNWMVVSWSFGDLPVPLSWRMASMEADMARGTFMVDYAKSGFYKDKPFLLNKDQTALRDDLQKRISSLKLKFIK